MTRAKALSPVLEAKGPFDPRDMALEDAQAELAAFYVGEHGYVKRPPLLTLPESQKKLGMSARRAVGLTLAPAGASGAWDVCMWRTPACTAACVLTTAGNARYPSVKDARVVKTLALAEHPQAFVTVLDAELREQVRAYGPIDFRPNVGSDLRWERIAPRLFRIRGVRVYDYTKAPEGQRERQSYSRLVFSVSERDLSVERALEDLRTGENAAVVFDTPKGHALPKTWHGFKVIDADTSDSRVDDPRGRVVGLRAKGAARGTVGDEHGFVKPGRSS